ncbi:MAG: NifU family protein [Pseudonocardiales bacterium]
MQTAAVDAAAVESALEEIRPHLHGGVELVGIDGDEVRVRLHGTCADCAMRAVTLQTGVERILRARVPGIGAVVAV